jgi:hypothetical protein
MSRWYRTENLVVDLDAFRAFGGAKRPGLFYELWGIPVDSRHRVYLAQWDSAEMVAKMLDEITDKLAEES